MAIEWSLVIFSLLAGIGGCTFAYVAISEFTNSGIKSRFSVTLVALILTLIGGCASVTHLASPQNVMAAVQNLFSFSGISIELILIGITLVLMIIYLVLVKREAVDGVRKVVAILGLIAGLLLAFFTGHGYVLQAQPTWDTQALPFAYLGTALAAGAFLYVVVAAIQDAEDAKKMALPVSVGAIVGVISILVYVFALGLDKAGSEPLVLWGGLVLCGCVVVAVCAVLTLAKKDLGNPVAVPAIGLVTAFVGALSIRALMWLVGGGFMLLFDLASGARIIIGD
jgi:anaerobic dimethyl sulfoxide reductase subunit C (anchor subunit)